ncbi:MAG: hypothetical protein JJW03_06755 [Desulfosarcina sp.]|nr:hypothetical protein [Desulfobacterales bacterium]
MARHLIYIFFFALLFLFASFPYADQQNEIIENTETGTINWSKSFLKAIGTGSPPEQIYGKENARLLALKSARQDALRNLLEVTKDVRIDSNTSVKKIAGEHDVIESKVQEMVRDAQVINKKYMSDGTVEVAMLMSLHGGFAQLVLPADIKQISTVKIVASNHDASVFSSTEDAAAKFDIYTGLIVDAGGINAKPAMAVAIFDENDKEIYGSAFASREFAVQKCMSGYVKNMESARKDPRIAGNPLTVKGLRTKGPGRSNIIISNADASKIHSVFEHLAFLKECRVVIIIN